MCFTCNRKEISNIIIKNIPFDEDNFYQWILLKIKHISELNSLQLLIEPFSFL